MDFSRSFTADTIYYHARDFAVTISYNVGELVCPPRDLTGRYGPLVQITPTPPDPITEAFTIQAAASDPDGTINRVRFEVWNESETILLGYYDDYTAPYCLFGDAGGACITLSWGYLWPGDDNLIENGRYVIYVQARDNDSPRQYTRIQQVINLDLPEIPPPPTSTPVPTAVPTATNTRTPTRTPTQNSGTNADEHAYPSHADRNSHRYDRPDGHLDAGTTHRTPGAIQHTHPDGFPNTLPDSARPGRVPLSRQ